MQLGFTLEEATVARLRIREDDYAELFAIQAAIRLQDIGVEASNDFAESGSSWRNCVACERIGVDRWNPIGFQARADVTFAGGDAACQSYPQHATISHSSVTTNYELSTTN